MWVGFCSEEVLPSPKSQVQLVGVPVEVSVKLTTRGALPEIVSAVKFASEAVSLVTSRMAEAKFMYPPSQRTPSSFVSFCKLLVTSYHLYPGSPPPLPLIGTVCPLKRMVLRSLSPPDGKTVVILAKIKFSIVTLLNVAYAM